MENQLKFHLGLNVSDISQTVKFYEKLFNQPPKKVKKDYAKFELENPGLVISFIESKANVRDDFGHLGFRVNSAEELKQKKESVRDLIEIKLEEENTACCYARQDKFWINDPDGYEWEVYHFIEDVGQNDPKYSASPCC